MMLSPLIILFRGFIQRKWVSCLFALLVILSLHNCTVANGVENQMDTVTIDYEKVIQLQSNMFDSLGESVRTEKVYRFTFKNGELEKKGTLSSFIEYDQIGNITNENGKLFFYDDLNRIIKETDQNMYGKIDTILYSYNSNNLVTLEEIISDEYLETIKYQYDSNGNEIRCKWYTNGILEAESFRKYDSLNREISNIHKNYVNNTVVRADTFIYNGNSKITFEKDLKGGIQKRVFVYDSLGNEIEQKTIDSDGNVDFRSTIKYNTYGKLISKYLFIFGKNILKKKCNYDDNGLLTHSIDYYGYGNLKRLEYSYVKEHLVKIMVRDYKTNEPVYEILYLYEFW